MVLDLALFLLTVLAPGVALWHAASPPGASALERWAGGATVGLFLVPLLSYSASVLAATHISRGLIAAVGLTLLAGAAGVIALRTRRPKVDAT